ncbi:MAG: TonB-dependent receptor [Paludibacteraceae bacterium]|nr:TonB-dependent receptor [Paludibacteraceae bacterium]
MMNNHFKLKIFTFGMALLFSVAGNLSNAQQIAISGKVIDSNTGDPIIGANILEKGTTNGTITNYDGEFTLNVAADAVIIVKYVGYKPLEIPVAGKRKFTIKLEEDVITLGEVVAIGYGTVKKTDATGSVTAIKPDAMNKGQVTNAQDMLLGKIAGVNITTGGGTPGTGATIRIRGGSSLNASNDPLIVIDGLPIDNNGIKGVANQLSTINPNDIESFTVLKDASATAIYGSRASNGVILITTKKGSKSGKPKVSYDGNVSLSTLNKRIEVLKGDEFRALVNQVYSGDGQTDIDARNAMGTENTDWQDQIYRNAFSQDHNISVVGGIKNTPYRVSVGYTNQNGIIKTSYFERYTGSINLSPSFFDDHLKFNLNGKGMFAKNRFADGGAVGAALTMDPTHPVKTDDPEFQRFGGYWQWFEKNTNGTFKSINTNATKNPVALLEQKRDVSKANDFIGNAEVDYKFFFLPELKAHLSLGIESSYGKQDLHIDSTATSDYPWGRTGWDKIEKTNRLLNFYFQYAKEINKHSFDIMGGYEWQHYYREGQNEYRSLEKIDSNNDGVIDENDGYYNHITPDQSLWKTENYLVSFFGRLNYSLAGKYLLTATLRDDGSSRFAPENRWALFPSVALAWKISEEHFISERGTFSDLKLRLGYGITGQQDISQGDYPYIPVYTISKEHALYPFGNEYYYTSRPDAYNKLLKWEQTTTWNAGLDAGIFNNRLTGSLDYYFRKTNDLINVVSVPAGTNFRNKVISNIGSLENKGIEFMISGKPISNKNCTWDISYNVTYNKNRITKLTTGNNEGYFVATGGIFQGSTQAHTVGYPSNTFYVYQQIYDENGKPIEAGAPKPDGSGDVYKDIEAFVDRDGNNTITEDDKYFYKSAHPDYTMGLSSKFIYKSFDIGFSMHASIGNYVYNAVAAERLNVGDNGIYSLGYLSNKPKSALKTNFQGTSPITYLSDYFVENGSFLRCDNITIGYSFNNLFKAISSLRIYAAVQNPFLITGYSGLDPEIFGGIDNNIYPRPMTTLLGLSVNF